MSKKFLSKLVHHRTYANYLPELKRRETIEETIKRNAEMHISRFPHLREEIEKAYENVYAKRAVPSMRSFQFAGDPILRRHNRMYNCSFINITSVESFADLAYMSMSGCGVGYSVKQRHVSQLPVIPGGHPCKRKTIPDTAEGWADSVIQLFDNPQTEFDYRKIRPAGAPLSSGGTASGPNVLIEMHAKVRDILLNAVGRQLTSFECHRICCLIANCIVAGGVRRSALICLFDYEDKETMFCKSFGWWDRYPELARANNSCHILKSDPNVENKIREIVSACLEAGQGEPGILLTNDLDSGKNPCAEIALDSHGVCNLTEVNAAKCTSPEEFFSAIISATIIGTLQASYTDFQYVSPKWKKRAEEDALLGVSITGQAEAAQLLTPEVLKTGAELAVEVNKIWAVKLGIRPAKRITTVKPSGTASSWLETTAGIHAAHGSKYIRRVRLNKDSALGQAVSKHFGPFVTPDPFASGDIVLTIPIEFIGSEKDIILRDKETAIELLERVKKVYSNWVLPGHVEGVDTHNISLTVNYHPHEKEVITEWMVKNRDYYYGISLLPHDGADYKYAPYMFVHPEIHTLAKGLFSEKESTFDFNNVFEEKDNTDKKLEAACAGGACTLE